MPMDPAQLSGGSKQACPGHSTKPARRMDQLVYPLLLPSPGLPVKGQQLIIIASQQPVPVQIG